MPAKKTVTEEERQAAKQAYNKAYYLANQEKVLAKNKEYRDTHRAEIQAQHQEYYADNRETLTARDRAYHHAHREERNAHRRAHHHAHREENNAKSKAYHEANREEQNAKTRAYYAEHQEEIAVQKKEYYTENREDIRAQHKAYSIANPEQRHASTARYRARKANASVNDLSEAQWEEIKATYSYRCVYCPAKCQACKNRTHKLTQDHLTSFHDNGNHTVPNVLPACQSCNSKKHTGRVLKPVQPLLFTIAPAKPAKTRKKKGQL